MAKRAPSRSKAPSVPVWLLHGDDQAALGLARTEIIERLVPEEMRAENVTEYSSGSPSGLRIKTCLGEILDDLSTGSFFPEHRRVVVVQDLYEFTSKPAKEAEPMLERLAKFLKSSLAEIGNAAIFTVSEEPDRWKKVNRTGALFNAIAEVGEVRSFQAESLNFAFQDALLGRDLGECMRIVDRRLEQAKSSDQLMVLRSMFNDMVKFTRFLIETKIAQRRQEIDSSRFPSDKRLNVLKQHEVVQRKVKSASKRFKLGSLLAVRRELQRHNRHFAPSLEDLYVADPRLLLEHLIAQLCAQES